MKKILTISFVALGLTLSYAFTHAPCGLQKACSQQQPKIKEDKYRLIVSFASKGTGANSEQREAFVKYVEAHPKKPVYKTIFWGREGEADYCFMLKELSKKEQAAFIKEVKKIVSPSTLAFVEENAAEKHKGR